MNKRFDDYQFSFESEQEWRFAAEKTMQEPMEEEYVVNTFSLWHRIRNTLVGLGLLAYGAYGVWKDDLSISWGKLNRVYLHGAPAWVMYVAMICGAAVSLSVVLDHYDQRNNEAHYECFRRVLFILGFILGFGVLLWHELSH